MHNRIKELREANNISQTELAEELGITRQGVSLYENNERKNIPKEVWQKLANLFGVSVEYLKGYGYTKDDIYEAVASEFERNADGTYKFDESEPRIEILQYCNSNSIRMPYTIDSNFIKGNFEFIFDNLIVVKLLTTKDSYSKHEIAMVVKYAVEIENLGAMTNLNSPTEHRDFLDYFFDRGF